MSTVDPTTVQKMHKKLAARGVDLIDAPVSGMEQGAKLGTLKAFVGGDALAVEKAQPVLKAMAAEVIHLGPIGQGLAMNWSTTCSPRLAGSLSSRRWFWERKPASIRKPWST